MRFLVIVASSQAYNRYPDGSTEQFNLTRLAQACADLARGQQDLQCHVASGAPDDGTDPLLRSLAAQLDGAATWLRVMGAAPRDSLILSLHSDSGTESHLANCYGGEVGGPSYQAGEAVCGCLEAVMHTDTIYRLDYSEYMFYRRRAGYTSVLVECGSHQSPRDLVWLTERREQLAEAILAGVLGYLELAPSPSREPDWDPVSYFSAYGVGCNPATAIYRYWREAYRLGDVANLGPALGPEESGSAYGLPAEDRVQKFASGILHAAAGEGWKVRRAMVCQEPERWLFLEK